MRPSEPRPGAGLPALWAEYKALTSRHLPAPAGRLVRSRRFDRLLLVCALYSALVLALAAIGLVAGTDLLGHVTSAPASPAGLP